MTLRVSRHHRGQTLYLSPGCGIPPLPLPPLKVPDVGSVSETESPWDPWEKRAQTEQAQQKMIRRTILSDAFPKAPFSQPLHIRQFETCLGSKRIRKNLNGHRYMVTRKWPKNEQQRAPPSFSHFFAPSLRTRRIGANPEKSDLVNFRGPD